MLKERITSFFKVNDNYKITIISIVITFFVGFTSYSAFIVYEFASPDGILEGFHFYTNLHWAVAGCGRWFLPLLDILHANLVFPWLTIVECMLVNWLSAHTICKIFKIDNKIYYFLVCVLFAVLPTFIEMFTYTYLILSYCISVLFCILFVYFNLYNNKYLTILAGVLLGCAMGSYQSQIGIAVGLTVMCLIIKILNKENNILRFTILSLISGILGLIVYVVGLNVFLRIYNLTLFSRATSFSLVEVFSNFIPRFIYSYKVFFETFNQIILKRWIIYVIIFIIFIIEFIIIIFNLLKRKEYLYVTLFVILVLLLPPALNIIGIILPSQPITQLMLSPNYIMIPFILGLGNYIEFKTELTIRIVLSICVLGLTWTYVLSANATYDSYRLSYGVYKTQFSNALDKVLELDKFKINSTRIVVIGKPNDYQLREYVHTYNYAINLYSNLLYWDNLELDPIATNIYIINEFGIDPGVMEYDEYEEFIKLQECIEMPCWPNNGSVKMVNDCAVIKFSEVYE